MFNICFENCIAPLRGFLKEKLALIKEIEYQIVMPQISTRRDLNIVIIENMLSVFIK